MSQAATLLAEFEQQAPVTRRFLERLPEDKLLWRPHSKSLTAGQLAFHLAYVPWRTAAFAQANPAPVPDFSFPAPDSVSQILAEHDAGVEKVRDTLSSYSDNAMNEIWRMVDGGREMIAMPRGAFLRNIMLNHWYQHRGQFAVYLRLLDVPVPASWGPSGDEAPQAFTKSA